MTTIGFFSSLISFASIGSWIMSPLMGISLAIDGLVYTLVSYSFKLFMLMCQINFDSLYGIIANLLDSIQAVILVLVVFKLATELITYLTEPDKALAGGKQLLINIAVASALLILYPFIFSVLNEVSILIMGNDTNYSFPTLGRIADLEGGSDEGLIMRFLFGEDISSVGDDVGDYLAFSTMSIFIHDISESTGNSNVLGVVCPNGECNFHNLPNLVSKLDKQVEYHWGVSALLGLFLVYSIARNAIGIGVRMFKLLILQMLAPIAIITIIKDGPKGKTFNNYCSVYLTTWAQAFIRMLTLLLVTVFVCKFYLSIGDFFGDNLTADMPRITKLLLTALIVFAAYQFAGQIPDFISSILGKKVDLGGGGLAGFGHTVGGILGTGAGAIGGLTAGIAGGAGVVGSLGNMVAGGVRGAGSGARANNVAEFFRNNGENTAASRQRARQISAAGGGLRYAGHAAENALGITAARQARVQTEQDRLHRLENYDNAVSNAMGNDAQGNAYGSSVDDYVTGRGDAAVASRNDSAREAEINRLQEEAGNAERRRLERQYQSEFARLNARETAVASNPAGPNGRLSQDQINEINSISQTRRRINDDIDRHAQIARDSFDRDAALENYNNETTRIRSEAETNARASYESARSTRVDSNRDVGVARRALDGSNTRAQRAQVDSGNARGALDQQRARVSDAQHRGSLERQNRQNLGS